MERVMFDAGTVDVHRVVDQVASRTVAASGDQRPGALDRQRSLLAFYGSEGPSSAAHGDIASWSAEELLRNSIACMIGLLSVVSDDQQVSIADVVATIEPPRPAGTPEGTLVGEDRCSLRAILAPVAHSRDVAVPVSSQSTPSSEDTFTPR
jgi:hypothetical protein